MMQENWFVDEEDRVDDVHAQDDQGLSRDAQGQFMYMMRWMKGQASTASRAYEKEMRQL